VSQLIKQMILKGLRLAYHSSNVFKFIVFMRSLHINRYSWKVMTKIVKKFTKFGSNLGSQKLSKLVFPIQCYTH
jgi:hypothetical protein